MPQAAQTLPQELDRAHHGVCCIEGCGQEQLAQYPACQQVIHLFLIFLIDAATVGAGNQCIQLRIIKAVAAQSSHSGLAGTSVADHHIAGALIDLGLGHGVMMVQISFQHIGTVQGHPHIADVHPHPTFAFMKNSTFHR